MAKKNNDHLLKIGAEMLTAKAIAKRAVVHETPVAPPVDPKAERPIRFVAEVGEQGIQGEKGEKGERGEKGEKGERGLQGPQGEPGTDGKDGAAGKDGKTGKPGAKGDKGDTGASGVDGDGFTWKGKWHPGQTYKINDVVQFEGSAFVAVKKTRARIRENSGDWQLIVARGTPGPTGAAGRNGSDGAAGATGPQGPAGADGSGSGGDGAAWFHGDGAPSDSLGADGDYYLDALTGDVFQHGGSVGWNFAANIKGATGATGAQGATGPQGPAGDSSGGIRGIDVYQDGVLVQALAYGLEFAGSDFALSVNSDASVNITARTRPFIGDAAPANPLPGQLWWNSADGNLYIYYNDGTSSQWVISLAPLGSGLSSVVGSVIDGGGAAITTGIKGDIGPFAFACTIEDVSLLADQSGSIVVDIWKDSYANFPPTAADSITAAAKPTISAAVKSQDTTLTGWTTAIAIGDILRFNVDSAATIQRVSISMKVNRT